MPYTIKDDEIAILVKPTFDEDGNWTQEVRTGMVMGKAIGENELAGRAAMISALNMAATLMYLDENPEFEYELSEIRQNMIAEMFPDLYAEALAQIEEEEGYTKDGNVLTLNAWTKTEGNA